jgi:hypothetical protein
VKKPDTGYSFDPRAGATYNFEHSSLAAAQAMAQAAEVPTKKVFTKQAACESK